MTLEDTQTPEEEVIVATETEQAAAPSDDDAAFEQGFSGVEAPAPAAEPEPEPEPAPEPEPQPEPEFQLTPAQAKELYERSQKFEQQVSKAFGTIGALKQQIDQLKAQPSQVGFKLTADKLKRLHAEFPEMAAMLSEDLNEAMAASPAAPSAEPTIPREDQERLINERLEQLSREKEQKILTIAHRDWPVVVQSPEFNAWKEKLPAEEREQLDNSWDAVFVADKISEFKDWKNKTVQTTAAKRTRLEAAITPRGNPQRPPAPSDDDAFVQGFNQGRGIR